MLIIKRLYKDVVKRINNIIESMEKYGIIEKKGLYTKDRGQINERKSLYD